MRGQTTLRPPLSLQGDERVKVIGLRSTGGFAPGKWEIEPLNNITEKFSAIEIGLSQTKIMGFP